MQLCSGLHAAAWQQMILLTVQSTYCDNIRQHCETVGRTVHVVNLGMPELHVMDTCVVKTFYSPFTLKLINEPLQVSL